HRAPEPRPARRLLQHLQSPEFLSRRSEREHRQLRQDHHTELFERRCRPAADAVWVVLSVLKLAWWTVPAISIASAEPLHDCRGSDWLAIQRHNSATFAKQTEPRQSWSGSGDSIEVTGTALVIPQRDHRIDRR